MVAGRGRLCRAPIGPHATVAECSRCWLARKPTLSQWRQSGFSPAALRELAWQLEGSGVDLLVSPALTDVAGTADPHATGRRSPPAARRRTDTGRRQAARKVGLRPRGRTVAAHRLGTGVAWYRGSDPANERGTRGLSPAAIWSRWRAVHHLQVPDDARRCGPFIRCAGCCAGREAGRHVRQGRSRRPGHCGRQLLAALFARRIAAADQRVARTDVDRRTATACPPRSRRSGTTCAVGCSCVLG